MTKMAKMAKGQSNNSWSIFHDRKLNIAKLLSFGFSAENGEYTYSVQITGNQFLMTVIVTAEGAVTTKVIDISLNEEYILHRIVGAVGSFVSAVRADYENTLQEIYELAVK